MKKAYVYTDLTEAVKEVDVRAQKFTTAQVDKIIDDGYAELSTIVQAFSDEEVVPLDPFYEVKEYMFTLDIEADVIEIYDLYLTKEGLDKTTFDYGIEKTRDKRIIYKDNRYNGRVHVDLEANNQNTALPNNHYNNAILKYYYVPTHTTDTVYMDAQTWLAVKSALAAATYDKLHDVERNGQKRSEMTRRAKAIIPTLPEDGVDPNMGHIFYGMDF